MPGVRSAVMEGACMKIRHIVVAAGAGLALVAAGTAAGAAIAAGPVSSGVIHACYATRATTHGSHSVVLENAGRACPAGTTALTWNQQGRPGARGAAGPAGPSTAGPAGLDVQVVSAGTGADVAKARCPVDHPYVVGGGYSLDSGTGPVVTNMPEEGTPPFTSVANTGGWVVQVSSGSTVGAWAVCAK
jgi:hypothetical protein